LRPQKRRDAKFHELVFGLALVDLGSKLDAEFDLALWYRAWTLGSTRRCLHGPGAGSVQWFWKD
jgi:hypothetical protein